MTHIETLKISDIDFEKNCIATKSKKTKKCMASRPVSMEVMSELSEYVCRLDVGQEKLFRTKFGYRQWRKICKKAGLTDLKFHDLRRTFCSLLAQNGVPFDRSDSKTFGTFISKSHEQGVYKCRSSFAAGRRTTPY